MAKAYATTRMPTHQARAVQMLVLVLAGWCASRSRIVLTMDVTGWLSAKARTGPGMVAGGTNAELMNGRKMSGGGEGGAASGGGPGGGRGEWAGGGKKEGVPGRRGPSQPPPPGGESR